MESLHVDDYALESLISGDVQSTKQVFVNIPFCRHCCWMLVASVDRVRTSDVKWDCVGAGANGMLGRLVISSMLGRGRYMYVCDRLQRRHTRAGCTFVPPTYVQHGESRRDTGQDESQTDDDSFNITQLQRMPSIRAVVKTRPACSLDVHVVCSHWCMTESHAWLRLCAAPRALWR